MIRLRSPLISGLALALLSGSVFAEPQVGTKPAASQPASAAADTPAKVLVVVYSKTGNTMAVAQQIIERFDTDRVEIKAEGYDSLTGGLGASLDAWTEVEEAEIKPATVDMSGYDLIFLGAPIWWYRPAVPMWTFVEKNSFKGKKVVFFSTFNSKFKPEYMKKFKQLIEKQGGELLDHIHVRRGRWYAQMSREELLKAFGALLDRRAPELERVRAR